MNKLRNSRNFTLTPADCEAGGGKSETILGDSYTVKEIVERFANGLSVSGGKAGVYLDNSDHDSIDLEKVNHLDLFEKEELAWEQAEKVKNLKGKAKKEQDDAIASHKEKAAAERQKLIDELRQPLPPTQPNT